MGLRSRVDRLAGRVGRRTVAVDPYWPPMVTVAVGEDGQSSPDDQERIGQALEAAGADRVPLGKGQVRIIVAKVPEAALTSE